MDQFVLLEVLTAERSPKLDLVVQRILLPWQFIQMLNKFHPEIFFLIFIYNFHYRNL